MLRAKVVVVGEACVGKTAVVQMFKSGGHDYPKNYIMVRKRVRFFPRRCIEACLRRCLMSAEVQQLLAGRRPFRGLVWKILVVMGGVCTYHQPRAVHKSTVM